MPARTFPTRRTGRGAASTVARLVAGGATIALAAFAVDAFLGDGPTAMLLLFGGPLWLIVAYDVRRARERDEQRRRDRMVRAVGRARDEGRVRS